MKRQKRRLHEEKLNVILEPQGEQVRRLKAKGQGKSGTNRQDKGRESIAGGGSSSYLGEMEDYGGEEKKEREKASTKVFWPSPGRMGGADYL